MGFGIETLRTLSVVAIVYGSQATIYGLRARRASGAAPDDMARSVLCGRHSHYLNLGRSRDCDGATARLGAAM